MAGFPEAPGVYLMKDARGRVLYIGKAKCLRDRVRSYFREDASRPAKTRRLMGLVREVEYLETGSEVEALLLESRLIKDVQPRYNERLRDAKSYPTIAIERGTDYPAVLVLRGTERQDLDYFGPFAEAGALRRAVQALQRVFRFRTCELDIRAEDRRWRHFRPCLLASIGQCTAPCNLRITREDYGADVEAFRSFLTGDHAATVAALRAEMERASRELRFERAAVLRDQVAALGSLARMASGDFAEAPHFLGDPADGVRALGGLLGLEGPARLVEGLDVAHLQGEEAVASLVVFVDGLPFKDGYRRFRLREAPGGDDYAAVREVVRRRARRVAAGEEPVADVLLVDGGPGQLSAAARALGAAAAEARPRVLLSLAKRQELVYREGQDGPYRLPRHDAALRLLQYVRDEAHRFAGHYHRLLRGRRHLGGRASGTRRPARRGPA
ncbi:MAG: UvrB/UvrC motif-containing protein [Planctomycetes bacterium]|nr:UvrB/UvrC motif-containing protein [Planctomycetota bacterium]